MHTFCIGQLLSAHVTAEFAFTTQIQVAYLKMGDCCSTTVQYNTKISFSTSIHYCAALVTRISVVMSQGAWHIN